MDELAASDCRAALVISDRTAPDYARALPGKATVVYRSRSLAVGMGCRRGVPLAELETLLDETLEQNNLSKASVRCIATAELKRDEEGIILLAEKLGVEMQCYGADQLNAMFDNQTIDAQPNPNAIRPTPSPTAHRLIGVWGVSEPAALLSSNAQTLLVTRQKTQRATIAIARIPFP